jgi:cell fate (sporulation/competence/biofilm development) regulator YmcA (YheA/YmcA/DUF963 family)
MKMAIKLTLAIKDIMKATKCSAEQAQKVECEMNNQWLVDWSQDSQATINREAKCVYKELFGE